MVNNGNSTPAVIKEKGQVARYRFRVVKDGAYTVRAVSTANPKRPLLAAVYGAAVVDSPSGKVVAAEGTSAVICATLKADNLPPDKDTPSSDPVGTYYLEIRDADPRNGTGAFTVDVRSN